MKVLLLNKSYEPLMELTHRHAFHLVFTDRVHVERNYEWAIGTSSGPMTVPAVIRLKRRVSWIPRLRPPTRRGIFLRDNYLCVYCSDQLTSSTATLDHVMPKSRGGGESWDNLVTSCQDCNNRKGDSTPEEASMYFVPTIVGKPSRPRKFDQVPEWADYLF